MELEQSTVRISICNNEIEAADECGNLQTQIEEVTVANPDKACSAFGWVLSDGLKNHQLVLVKKKKRK